MKRRLFFILEKLEIKRSERMAISFLFIFLVILSGMLTFLEPEAKYSEDEYRQIEKVFREKSEAVQQEKDLILARYEPNRELPVAVSVLENSEMNVAEQDTSNQTKPESQPGELLDINTATNTQLQELPGIGPAYAGRIVTWRELNGNFTSKDQLLEIKGIGEKRLAKIKPLITL